MTERPILFSGPMVRAILDGKKTQTRRVVKPRKDGLDALAQHQYGFCPYGHPGDRLWVRETWRPEELDAQGHDEIGDPLGDYPDGTDGIRYRADDAFIPIENSAEASDRWHSLLRPHETWPELRPTVWRPSIHMPRWASRITLEVTGVRVERLQQISNQDAYSEGLRVFNEDDANLYYSATANDDQWPDGWHESPVNAFRDLWDSINASRGHGWDTNPWVWVVEFKRVAPK